MSEQAADTLKAVFSTNLKRYMARDKMNTADLANALSLPFSTVSDWVHGRKYPRMDKVQIVADFFGIMKSDLTEESGHPLPPNEKQPPAQDGEPPYPPEYDLLTPANKAIVDRLIADLAKNQSSD